MRRSSPLWLSVGVGEASNPRGLAGESEISGWSMVVGEQGWLRAGLAMGQMSLSTGVHSAEPTSSADGEPTSSADGAGVCLGGAATLKCGPSRTTAG